MEGVDLSGERLIQSTASPAKTHLLMSESLHKHTRLPAEAPAAPPRPGPARQAWCDTSSYDTYT